MREEIVERLKRVISDIEELSFLNNELDLSEDIGRLGINSLMFIKLIVAVENEFDIEFDDDDLDLSTLDTLNDFVDYIEQLIQ